MVILEPIGLLCIQMMIEQLILIVLELNIFQKKLNVLLVIKIWKQIFIEYKHMIQ